MSEEKPKRRIITGKELQHWIEQLYMRPSCWEPEDKCVVALIITEIANHGEFDCEKYQLDPNKQMACPDPDQDLSQMCTWITIPFVLEKR